MARNLTQNFKAPTPVLAVIGVGDLAVEKIREVGSDVQARSARITLEPRRLQADLEQATRQRVEDVRAAQHKAQQRAGAVLNDVVTTATTTYDNLAGRGKTLVDRVTRQQATQDLRRTASTTSSQAKATSTTAKKAASTTGSTARKSAAQTKSRAKATGTSARKTANAAGQATQDTAKKVGD